MKKFIYIFILPCLLLATTACHTTQRVTDNNLQQTTKQQQKDSIYVHDSIYVTYRQAKQNISLHTPIPPDTIYLERWHTRWRERIVTQTDTITQTKIETQTQQVRYVPSIYKYCTAFAILVILYLLAKVVRKLIKH